MNTNSGMVILTGAGISAESGIKTFRDGDGLWENHRIEDVATPEGFFRNPEIVQRFYNERRGQLKEVSPNAAHTALAELEHVWPGPFLLITQNVDDLHDRAGSVSLLHMHGELMKVRCVACGRVSAWEGDVLPDSGCPACQAVGKLRPHIVWFGEMPLELNKIGESLRECDYFAAIGTSGHVYPAAGFVQWVPPSCHTIELNLEPSLMNSAFMESRKGPATKTVSAWVREMLSQVKR
jgi:NAD-dependent deacetylase